jgi:hypothetical protein
MLALWMMSLGAGSGAMAAASQTKDLTELIATRVRGAMTGR